MPGKFQIIYSDPPWRHRDSANSGGRGATFHYDTMSDSNLEAMRPQIDEWAAKDCVLFMWATCPMLPEAFVLLKAWGFKYRTVGFVWVKTGRGTGAKLQRAVRKCVKLAGQFWPLRLLGIRRLAEHMPAALDALNLIVLVLHWGMGNWTRANVEVCLIATRGQRPPRQSASVHQVVFAPSPKEHSEKPDDVRDRIVQLMGDLPRLEMFCRHSPTGWACHGDEVGKLKKGG